MAKQKEITEEIETFEHIGLVTISPKQIIEFEGKKQIGFQIDKFKDTWFNCHGTEEVLKEVMKLLKKGNKIKFIANYAHMATEIQVLEESKQESRHGGSFSDDMTNFEDLLSNAHEKFKGKFSINTEVVSVDFEKKQALVKARVTAGEGATYEAHGDATMENLTNKVIQPHFIRMAETRAISRALRWATNNASVSEEETNKH